MISDVECGVIGTKIMLVVLAIALLPIGAYANFNSVSQTNVQELSGTLTNIYFETANGASGSTPTINTSLMSPTSSGSFQIYRGSTLYLWSPQFPSTTTIPAGKWILELVTQTNSVGNLGTLTVTIVATTSSGSTSATIVSTTSTQTITSSKNQVVSTFSGSSITVPAGGYIKVALLAPTGSNRPSFTIFWGTNQCTNFQFARSLNS